MNLIEPYKSNQKINSLLSKNTLFPNCIFSFKSNKTYLPLCNTCNGIALFPYKNIVNNYISCYFCWNLYNKQDFISLYNQYRLDFQEVIIKRCVFDICIEKEVFPISCEEYLGHVERCMVNSISYREYSIIIDEESINQEKRVIEEVNLIDEKDDEERNRKGKNDENNISISKKESINEHINNYLKEYIEDIKDKHLYYINNIKESAINSLTSLSKKYKTIIEGKSKKINKLQLMNRRLKMKLKEMIRRDKTNS